MNYCANGSTNGIARMQNNTNAVEICMCADNVFVTNLTAVENGTTLYKHANDIKVIHNH